MYLFSFLTLWVIRLQELLSKGEELLDNCFYQELKRSPICFYILAISVTSPCPESTVEELGIKNWPIWTCQVSYFDWTYGDQEICLLLEGEFTVTPDGGEPVKFGEGDLVVIPRRNGP